MAQQYGTGSDSTIGALARTDFYNKKALIAVRDKQYFMPLANVQAMPKHHGKTIVQDVYLPLLDDLNVNDQGLDAGETAINNKWSGWKSDADGGLTLTSDAYATKVAAVAVSANVVVQQNGGNIYGSAKDVGVIAAKLPALTENGGRVNLVGFKRNQITGSIAKQGFFTEYTQESLDFDSDSELLSHITEEMVQGATELTEANLQSDLLNAAGTVVYCGGDAIADTSKIVTYNDLMALSIALDQNKTPKQTKVIAGSRMTDTKTINGGRIMYCGSEMIPALRAMTDLHGAPAFVSVEKYADAGNTVNGEIGSIDQFRIVVVPEMQMKSGAGAVITNRGANNEAAATGTAAAPGDDLYPMMVVGDGSFTTIGFQTDGKTVKFKTTHKKPGIDTADSSDPYGEKGFYSIKWYYGFMALRAERIAVVWTRAN